MFSEFVATFILLLWACMLQPVPGSEKSAMYQMMPALSVMVPSYGSFFSVSRLRTIIAGLALVIIITIFWDICVIQFNPSVTVSLVMAEIIPLR